MPGTPNLIEWLSLIDVSGPFLAGKVLEDAFPQGLDKVDTPRRQRLRAAYEEWRDAVDEEDSQLAELHDAWTRMVVAEALEYEDEVLVAREQLNGQVVHRVPEHGVEEKPDFAVRTDDDMFRLLISTYPPGTDLERPAKNDRWPVSPAERMTSLCRASEVRLGLITNGEQWMLVNAPIGSTSSYASWFARIWWQEPITLKAFVSLLGVRRCFGTDEGRLDQLLETSLEFQEDVTDSLGEQVRRAVEVLIQALGRADQDRNGELLKDVPPESLYEAGLTVMIRLVFILCAEERDLLLLGDPTYDQHYAISSLRARLREDADQHGVEVLERRKDAWSRILTVFRMVYAGVEYEALRMPALGGSLFDPDKFPFLEGRSPGSKWRDEAASPLPIDNRTVLLLMNALQVLEQKGGAQLLSYRALDVEQIGHVYEGLLEYAVARLPEPTVALIGSKKVPRPSITVRELESLASEPVDTASKKLADLTGRSKTAMKKAINNGGTEAHLVALIQACGGDETLAKRLLPFALLIQADSWESLLVYRDGSFAVVPGTDRRETGTHYTPRSLTETIVEKTLEPIVYVGPADGLPREQWKLKTPAELLGLKICDPAMGSGAFLVEACRYLSQRLVEAWRSEEDVGRVVSAEGEVFERLEGREPLPENLDDRLVFARRLVADRSLYGVDKNPLAVELAKLSLWLVTLSKNRPFAFLDHALRSGDSLVGLSDNRQLEQFALKEGDSIRGSLFGQMTEIISNIVESARTQREQLEHGSSNTFADIETKATTYEDVKRQTIQLKYLADVLIAAYWEGGRVNQLIARLQGAFHEHFDRFRNGLNEEQVAIANALRTNAGCPTPFHWPIEFPEVFQRENPGFDAIVGNPPFIGGRKIRGSLGERYLKYLTQILEPGASGNADLCSFFFLRAFTLCSARGCFGLLATNTIAEGDTRATGLERIVNRGGHIYHALDDYPWPGRAAVTVAIVHVQRAGGTLPCLLEGDPVPQITPSLKVYSVAEHTKTLPRNASLCYQGSVLAAKGFILTLEEAEELLNLDSRYSDVIAPYFTGDEVFNLPELVPQRMVINFRDWPIDVAQTYEHPFAIVQSKVLPVRSRVRRKAHREKWWHYGDKRPELYAALSDLTEALVQLRHAKFLCPQFAPANGVFSESTVVFPSDRSELFAILNSTIHDFWTRDTSGSLGTELRYTPTDCLYTFPLPRPSEYEELQHIGKCLRAHVTSVKRSRAIGVTSLYTQLHDANETSDELQQLRALHVDLDRSVARAYGWNDLDMNRAFHASKLGVRYSPSEVVRVEILQRLLELNHDRYEEEVREGLQ